MNPTHRGKVSKDIKKQVDNEALSPMGQVQLVTATENDEGQRIDNYLFKAFKGIPKSHVYRILRSGQVRVNRKRVDQTYRLAAGDVIRIPPVKTAQRDTPRIPDARFDILYEDLTGGRVWLLCVDFYGHFDRRCSRTF